MTTITLIRHAPIAHDPERGPVLCGRTDLPADLSDRAGLKALAAALPQDIPVLCSPSQRARQTAQALGLSPQIDEDFREQDFGEWDGLPLRDIPDLGLLDGAALAAHTPPGGESFADLCARIWPRLQRISATGDCIIVAHAGVVRAALALALGGAEHGLKFMINAPSLTQIASVDGNIWAICRVNSAK